MENTDSTDRESHEGTGCVGAGDSWLELQHKRIARLRVELEDEWQTAEDHLDGKRLSDSIYYLERLTDKANQIISTLLEILRRFYAMNETTESTKRKRTKTR